MVILRWQTDWKCRRKIRTGVAVLGGGPSADLVLKYKSQGLRWCPLELYNVMMHFIGFKLQLLKVIFSNGFEQMVSKIKIDLNLIFLMN